MRNLVRHFSLLTFILCLSACSNNSSENTPSNNEIQPLKVGNYWKFATYNFKNSSPDKPYDLDTSVGHITSIVHLNDEDWFTSENGEFVLCNRADGLWAIEKSDTFHIDSASIYLKYPTNPGDTWRSRETFMNLKTVSNNVMITVPAGSFRCVNYQVVTNSPDYYRSMYYAPGVGPVLDSILSIHDYTDKPHDSTWHVQKLIEYKVN